MKFKDFIGTALVLDCSFMVIYQTLCLYEKYDIQYPLMMVISLVLYFFLLYFIPRFLFLIIDIIVERYKLKLFSFKFSTIVPWVMCVVLLFHSIKMLFDIVGIWMNNDETFNSLLKYYQMEIKQ